MSILSVLETVKTSIQTAAAIVPHAIELVQSFEVPEAAGKGTDKKTAVVNVIHSSLADLPAEAKAALGGDNIISLIGRVVDIVVTFLNAVGVFKK